MQEQADGSKNSIQAKAGDKAAIRRVTNPHWFGWAGRHPGAVLLGVLVMAVLALPKRPRIGNIERDTTGEEVPLFI